jgi:hypothetical protein
MSQPTPITPEPTPPLIVLTTFAGHLAAITSGAEPFGALERPLVAGTDDQAAAPDDSLWPHIPGTGKGGKGGMSDLELGAFFARLVGPESLYHVSTPKGVRYRKLTSILGDHFNSHAALIGLWLDQAALLTPAADPERPWSEARLLTTEDLTQLAAQLKATPLPTADQIVAARERGLK